MYVQIEIVSLKTLLNAHAYPFVSIGKKNHFYMGHTRELLYFGYLWSIKFGLDQDKLGFNIIDFTVMDQSLHEIFQRPIHKM